MAMLAMAMLPALGRIAASQAEPEDGLARALAAMCTPSGLGQDSPALIAVELSTDLPKPGMPMPASGEDCVYCLLLHTLHIPTTATGPSAPPRGPIPALITTSAVTIGVAATGGTGPRGPPLSLS